MCTKNKLIIRWCRIEKTIKNESTKTNSTILIAKWKGIFVAVPLSRFSYAVSLHITKLQVKILD